jgi:hypothetical protein
VARLQSRLEVARQSMGAFCIEFIGNSSSSIQSPSYAILLLLKKMSCVVFLIN